MPGGPEGGPEQQELARRLAAARRAARLSQEELAARSGIGHQTKVSKIERGEQRPSRGDVQAWARTAGADPGPLLAQHGRADAEYQTWLGMYARSGGAVAYQRSIGELEARSRQVWKFQPSSVPGLVVMPPLFWLLI